MKLLNMNNFVRCSCTCNINDINNIRCVSGSKQFILILV